MISIVFDHHIRKSHPDLPSPTDPNWFEAAFNAARNTVYRKLDGWSIDKSLRGQLEIYDKGGAIDFQFERNIVRKDLRVIKFKNVSLANIGGGL